MRNVFVLMLNEWKVFFHTPFAMVLVPGFLVICCAYFYAHLDNYLVLATPNETFGGVQNLSAMDHLFRPFFKGLLYIFVLLVPLITMRSFSEEKRSGTYELLVSYPVRPTEMLIGKYLGLSCLALGFLVLTIPFAVIISIYGYPHVPQILTSYLGYVLFLLFYVAVGLVASLFTENQLIAAVATYVVYLATFLIQLLAFHSFAPLDKVFSNFLVVSHLNSFQEGLIFVGDLAVFACLTALVMLLGYGKLRRHYIR